MRINPKSIIFKTGLIYLGVTLLNVTIFNIMIRENQTDLIVENAKLNSLHKGSSLKHRIDNIIRNDADLTNTNLNKILKECQSLDIRFLTIFHENGSHFLKEIYGIVVRKKGASIHLVLLRFFSRE